eukprot:TRINITY_DN34476_c0_g1_i1.p1 TRINITY_DN34476_c0_g1~~TRINITY_DN34476_c0_g1_i1.p1  ORF type:complete len:214 (+),score=13.38 TRINITY_DN34476_c0_g1_i1:635-1276(+)
MGPKGTWTGLHCDVFGSYSWSANVVGRKKWWFLQPKDEPWFLDRFGNCPPDLTNVDEAAFPDFHKCTVLEVIQEPGELFFVPSKWYHQVVNLEDTISINHNWCSACNLDMMADTLLKELHSVEEMLSDCRKQLEDNGEWHQEVEKILHCSGAWNLKVFCTFVAFMEQQLCTTTQQSELSAFKVRAVSHVSAVLKADPFVKSLPGSPWPSLVVG